MLAFGTFDILHPGHIFFLQEARKLGDELWVLVACDQAVAWAKGHAPTEPAAARLARVQALACVDRAWLGAPVQAVNDYLKPIAAAAPAVVALGYDQALEHEPWLRSAIRGLPRPPVLVRLPAFQPDTYKSTLLKLPGINITKTA